MDRPPRLAVTSVLLHEQADDLEVLLLRRPSTMAAFGGMWVFPGGQVDDADDGLAARALIGTTGRTPADTHFLAPDPSCPDPPLLPLFTAACRELFEEVGVLLAVPREGGAARPLPLAALLERRDDILADAQRFYAELAANRLRLEIGRLVPWSRWITPPARTRRFDTIFFAAAVADRSVAPDAREVGETCWLKLDEAIREGLAGTRLLMAPTLLTLMQIAAAWRHHRSLAALLASAPAQLFTPVHPRSIERDGSHWIVFPWDGETGGPRSYAWRTAFLADGVPGRLRADF